MATILEMKKRFDVLNTDKLIEDTMTENQEVIADLNEAQMFSGLRKDGEDIHRLDGKYRVYAPLTEFIKTQKGQPTDRVTLQDTGSFYRGINVRVQGDNLVIESTDQKSAGLQKKYGIEIFGLSEKYRTIAVQQAIKPLWKEKIESATGLIMK